jgi:hypothetical protein
MRLQSDDATLHDNSRKTIYLLDCLSSELDVLSHISRTGSGRHEGRDKDQQKDRECRSACHLRQDPLTERDKRTRIHFSDTHSCVHTPKDVLESGTIPTPVYSDHNIVRTSCPGRPDNDYITGY